jgi:hypothetical protein
MMTTTKNAAEASSFDLGTEKDLEELRIATKKIYEALREINEDDLPPERKQEYWRNRHLARTAWERAENAAFANLVDEQKRRLPAVAVSNSNLAREVQATATVLAMLHLVSTSLSVLEEVITVLGGGIPS